jgi:hypothetical protein
VAAEGAEGCLRAEQGERYPLYLQGARACPPEDVGGTWGDGDFVEAVAFDPAKATRRTWRGCPTGGGWFENPTRDGENDMVQKGPF